MEMSVRDYKRAIADGKIDNWSPKDVEQWLHSSVGGIVGQDAACRAAALIVYNHFERRPSVSLFIGPTGCGKTEIWRALRQRPHYRRINPHRRRLARQQQDLVHIQIDPPGQARPLYPCSR